MRSLIGRKPDSARERPQEDLLSVPGMEELDKLTREVLDIDKEEIERREKAWQERKAKPKSAQSD